MKKRKVLVNVDYHYSPSIIISYTDKKYKVYDFNDNCNLVFYPEGVKIEDSNDSSYFTRFGKLYKRCAINVVNSKVYHHKKFNRHIAFPIDGKDAYCKIFDDLDAAKLWVAIQEEEKSDTQEEAYEECKVECEASDI